MAKQISGHQYEQQCAKRLKRCGFTKVTVTRGSGDQGIDVIAYRKGSKYGIQCKHYARPVGNSAVQEAYAGAKYYECDVAAVMTNSTFTKSAKELAESTGVCLWEHDTLPFSVSRFFLTRWMGRLVAALYLFAMVMSNFAVSDYIFPVLQNAYFVSAILGGLCNMFESGYYFVDVLACLCYLSATVLSVMRSAAFGHPPVRGDFYLMVPFLISFLRGLWLYTAGCRRATAP